MPLPWNSEIRKGVYQVSQTQQRLDDFRISIKGAISLITIRIGRKRAYFKVQK